MIKSKYLLVLLLLPISLSSCSENTPKEYSYEDYLIEVDTKKSDGFKILQLSDLHYGMSTDLKYEFEYLDSLIDRASPDLIVIDGDLFMQSQKYIVRQTFDYFSNKKINWTVTFGNHDKQGLYRPSFLNEKLAEAEYCLFKNLEDDAVYGDSNYFININKDGQTKWQVYLIDSNSYHFQWTSYGYDVIHDDQIEWYKNSVNETTFRKGKVIPSMAFFHIPTEEWNFAIEQHELEYADFDTEISELEKISLNSGNHYQMGHMAEKCCIGYEENNFVETALELGSTKAMFAGHDHINGMALDYTYEDKQIILSYGLKTGDCLYHNEDKMGGQLITLYDDETFSLKFIYQGYEGIVHE